MSYGNETLRMVRLGGMVAVALVAAACVTDIEQGVVTLWEANISGDGNQPFVTGNVAAVSRSLERSIQVGLQVEGLQAGTYVWGIVEGNCNAPGEILGAEAQYPSFAVEGDLTATAFETFVSGATMRSRRSYHTEIRREDSGARVACGPFEEQANPGETAG